VGIVTLLLFVVAMLAGSMAASRRWVPPVPPVQTERLRAAARTTRRWRLAGVVAGILVAVVSAEQGALGRGLLLAVPLGALCVLAGVVVGELQVSAPAGPVRSAVLEVRRVRDYLPRRLGSVVAGATALLTLTLAATTATGSADDLGRAGRSFARRCSAVQGGSTGPWPGSFYAVPLAVVVIAGLLLAAFALHRVVRRPRQGEDPVADDGLRGLAAQAVVAACGLLVAVPLAGVALVTASALANHVCPPAGSSVLVVALLLLSPASAGLGAWCAGVLLAPPRVGRAVSTPAAFPR
jgi:hypothetical protein